LSFQIEGLGSSALKKVPLKRKADLLFLKRVRPSGGKEKSIVVWARFGNSIYVPLFLNQLSILPIIAISISTATHPAKF